MDYEKFIRERITKPCIDADISEYQLSAALGYAHSKINGITRGKTLPSMSAFIALCEFFDITPAIFFDDGINAPQEIADLTLTAKQLRSEQVKLLIAVAKEMRKENYAL